jgi:2-keto-3-deoxy-6-phosphogluconate aldolase
MEKTKAMVPVIKIKTKNETEKTINLLITGGCFLREV